MAADIRVHPPPERDPREDEGLVVRSDPALIAQGWTRRNLADPDRAGEMIDLYRSLGYEVKVARITAADFGPSCGGCAPLAGRCYVLIYTRKTNDVADRAQGGIATHHRSSIEKEHPMEATRRLREEHRIILRVLDCFEIALREAQEAKVLDLATFEGFIEFFRGFADQCHHCKEEDRLFPVLVSAGIPKEGGPIGCMLAEHEQARAFVRSIAEQLAPAGEGDTAALRFVTGQGELYIDLLRNHIAKEDNILFNMADSVLDEPAVRGLARAYGEVETTPDYCRRLERCRAMADELSARYGVAAR